MNNNRVSYGLCRGINLDLEALVWVRGFESLAPSLKTHCVDVGLEEKSGR